MVCHRRIHNCYSLVCQKDRFKGCDSCRGTCQCNGRSSFQVVEEIRRTCTIFKKSFAGISFKWHQEAIQGHCSDCEKRIKSVFLHLGTFINCHLAWYITVLQTPNKLLLLTSKDLQGVTNPGLFLPLVSKSFSYFAKSSRNQSLIFCISAGRRF